MVSSHEREWRFRGSIVERFSPAVQIADNTTLPARRTIDAVLIRNPPDELRRSITASCLKLLNEAEQLFEFRDALHLCQYPPRTVDEAIFQVQALLRSVLCPQKPKNYIGTQYT